MNNKEFREQLVKRIYNHTLIVIKFLDDLDRKDSIIQVISKQLLRSITSVGANSVEAQAASSKKDFTNFNTHALKSANESKFWLGLIRDSGKAPSGKVNELLKETDEIARILGSIISTLRGKRRS